MTIPWQGQVVQVAVVHAGEALAHPSAPALPQKKPGICLALWGIRCLMQDSGHNIQH
jgi:hypothetical protein